MNLFLNPNFLALAFHNAAGLAFLVMTPNRHDAIKMVNDMTLIVKMNRKLRATSRQGRWLIVVKEKYKVLLDYCEEKANKKSSQYKYICFDKSRKKWNATWYFDKKMKNLGQFDSEQDAYQFQQKYLTSVRSIANLDAPSF
jgi:hypothetical protein